MRAGPAVRRLVTGMLVAAVLALLSPLAPVAGQEARQAASSGPRFEISFSRGARTEPVTGRVYVAISRDNRRTPIEQAGPTGVAAVLARTSKALAPGTPPPSIDATDRGHPVASLRDLPAGEYWVQPFVNVYTKFARADGKTVWLHMDQWEGQNWKRSPGNLYGDPVKVTFDPAIRATDSRSSPTR